MNRLGDIVLTELASDHHGCFHILRIPSGCRLLPLEPQWLRASSVASVFRLICQNNLTLIAYKVINYVRGYWYSVTSKTFWKRTLFSFLHENRSAWAWRRKGMQDKIYTLLSYVWIFLRHCPLSGFQITLILLRGATTASGPGLPHCRDFMITLRYITIGRTPLDEWSARRSHHHVQHTTLTRDRHPCPRSDS